MLRDRDREDRTPLPSGRSVSDRVSNLSIAAPAISAVSAEVDAAFSPPNDGPITGMDALAALTARDSQQHHSIKLTATHDGNYIELCHENGFIDEKVWERGDGLLPQFIKSEITTRWTRYIENVSTKRVTVPGLPSDFAHHTVFIDYMDFPQHFGNPVAMHFAPNFFANPDNMENAKKLVSHFLQMTFQDVTTQIPYTDTRYELRGSAMSPPNPMVEFRLALPNQPRLTINDITPVTLIDKKATVTFEVPSEIQQNGFEIVKNHTQWMIASGTPELAITNAAGQITDAYQLIPTRSRFISFQFCPRQLLLDSSGLFNFNLFIAYAFCLVLYAAPGGITRQGIRLIEAKIENSGLCGVCFGKNKTEDGRLACTRGDDCPFIGCCKLCWEPFPLEMWLRDHVLNHCPVFKQLKENNPAILPLKEFADATPLATNPESTNSVVGKRALAATAPTKRWTQADFKKEKKKALLAAKRSRRRPPSPDGGAGPAAPGPVNPIP